MVDRLFHKINIAVTILLAVASLVTQPRVMAADTLFAGMDANTITETIAIEYVPQRYAASDDEIMMIVASYAKETNGSFRDYFSPHSVSSISALGLQRVAPASWWLDYSRPANNDLHNIVPGNKDSEDPRRDYPPGVVTKADYDNGWWKAGEGTFYDQETGFYEPADELKGDFARIFMYMGIVYSRELWPGRSAMLYTDGGYPYLTAYSREILLKWHREDPVDESELYRNELIADFQGSGNPFVTDPKLAEYIWGNHSGETYPSDKTEPDEPDDPEKPEPDPSPLKPVYSLSQDKYINLHSPYIGADARWTIDGKAIDGLSISLEDIAPGRHELRYRRPTASGKLIITVTQ